MNDTSLASSRLGAPFENSSHQAGVDSTAVLSALNDADCRRILAACDGTPRTAEECASECSVPLSTVYRKLDLLSNADLLSEGHRILPHHNHPLEYRTNFGTLSVSLRGGEGLAVEMLQVATDGGRDGQEGDQ